MARKKSTEHSKLKYAEHVVPVRAGTQEKAELLQVGYGMSLEEAAELVQQRTENPAAVPWEQYKAAKAMLEAFDKESTVVSSRPGWRRNLTREERLAAQAQAQAGG